MRKERQEEPILSWEIDSPVLGNMLFWLQIFLVTGSGAGFVFFLLVGLNLYEGHWEYIPDSFRVGFFLFLGMLFLFALTAFLFYRGGYATQYRLMEEGIVQHTLHRKSRWIKWLALLGIFSGRGAGYTAAGAALLADARETIGAEWQEVDAMEVKPGKHEIILKNEWRPVMQVFTLPEDFATVESFIAKHVKEKSGEMRPPKAKELPFAYKILLSFFTLLFGFYLLPELPIRVIPIFTVILTALVLYALWASGRKKTISAMAACLLAIAFPAVSALSSGVHLQKDGAVYALALELFFYFFLAALALYSLRRKSAAAKT